ncbi:Maf-like protein [Lutibacter sp.]|uniref:Maf-like protein n=1 Tax=Lutibacter sp. TaxID=1925666 RepID=UPI001A1D9C5A|nr:Maf-like protein [Lutibacter sp.]MBI9042440.1 septum formation protein Maf [Lutibacter sp.]
MLAEKFKNNTIILASASPRRQELFKELQIPFSIDVKSVEEVYPTNLKGEEITHYLAILKATAFDSSICENDIIITSDTIVWLDKKALEKPKNTNEAIKMLQKLSGKSHQVITSVCIKTISKQLVFSDNTIVHFKKLSSEEINFYVENYHPFDKAGGYGIQEWIGFIGVTSIEGSYFNVMGLPVNKLYEELKKF